MTFRRRPLKLASGQLRHLEGWVNDPAAVEATMERQPFPVFGDANDAIKDSSAGKVCLPYKLEVKRFNRQLDYVAQTRGTCVGRAAAMCCDQLLLRQCAAGTSTWPGLTSPEVAYAGSRIEIGNGKIRGDGSIVAWAMDFLREYGVVARGVYKDNGETLDLSGIDDMLAVRLGARGTEGLPVFVEAIAKRQPVKIFSEVRGSDPYRQACDIIYNQGMVDIGTNMSPDGKRDSNGISRLRNGGGHSYPLIAFDDTGRDPCILADMRSWGSSFGRGDKRHGNPNGTTWIRAEDFEKAVKAGECHGITDIDGWDAQPFDWGDLI